VKNNKPGKNKINTSSLKKSYYITLENAEKRTHGWGNKSVENFFKHEKRPDR